MHSFIQVIYLLSLLLLMSIYFYFVNNEEYTLAHWRVFIQNIVHNDICCCISYVYNSLLFYFYFLSVTHHFFKCTQQELRFPTVYACVRACVRACVCVGGGRGRSVTTRMTPALRWVQQRQPFQCFINCEGQSHKTVSTDRNFRRERRAEAESSPGLHTQKKKAESSNALITARPKRLKAKAEECSPPQPRGSTVTTLQPLLAALST